MISAQEIDKYVDTLNEEVIPGGASRKFVVHLDKKIYLHPEDPRFGASVDGVLYSFRRPKGARGTASRKSGVDYGRPRELKGHEDFKGRLMITITPQDKRFKTNFVCSIFHNNTSQSSNVRFLDKNDRNLSIENISWK